jgi:patatin-like phospholipase/acyl hydrolase
MIPILSLYGGGTRGLISLEVLKEIKNRTNLEPAEAFHLLSGTSIGGIAAGILNLKSQDDPTKPAHKIEEFDKLFEADAKKIFPYRLPYNPKRLLWPEYDSTGLQNVLSSYAGDAMISEGIREIVIPAVCDEYRAPWYFTRNKIIHLDPERKLYHYPKANVMDGIKLTDILEATSAAPTYFQKKKIVIDEKPYHFRDGGISTNNPCLCAYSYAYHLNGASTDYLVCTIGTGKVAENNSYLDQFSYAYWGADYASYSIQATQEGANLDLSQFLPGEGEDQKFFVLQPEISAMDNTVDDTSPEHFARLKENARTMIENNEDSIRVLCNKLLAINNVEL